MNVLNKSRLPQKITRRKFLSTTGKVALGAAGILVGSVGLLYYRSSLKQDYGVSVSTAQNLNSIVNIGKLDRLQAIEGFERVDYEAFMEKAWSNPVNGYVFVTKDERGELIVMSPVCTHLGCTINQASEVEISERTEMLFSCPCHGAQFDKYGNELRLNLRPLDIYQPIIADGSVFIDISAPIQRN